MNTLELAILATSIMVGSPVMGDDIMYEQPSAKVQAEMVHLTAGYGSMMKDYFESSQDELEWQEGYCTVSSLNIRYLPTTDSESIGKYTYNSKIKYIEYDKDWNLVSIEDNDIGYVSASYVSDEKSDGRVYDVPVVAQNKTWMPYTAITSKSSPQYKLQQLCYTGDYGIRMYDGRYACALGNYFGCKVGQYFDLVLDNGTVLPCILADVKANQHTESMNIKTIATDCLSEFVVDRHALDSKVKRDGDMNSVSDDWNSIVKQVIVYDKVVEL